MNDDEKQPIPEFTPMDYDPFEGDFGDQGDRIFADGMVKARKPHECTHCGGPIAPTSEYRQRREKSDGEMRTWKWCSDCCQAMVKELRNDYADDDVEVRFPFVERADLHRDYVRNN